MKTDLKADAESRAQQADAVLRANRIAVRQTLIDHKQSGDPVVFCEGDEIRWVPAAEIEVPDLPSDSTSS